MSLYHQSGVEFVLKKSTQRELGLAASSRETSFDLQDPMEMRKVTSIMGGGKRPLSHLRVRRACNIGLRSSRTSFGLDRSAADRKANWSGKKIEEATGRRKKPALASIRETRAFHLKPRRTGRRSPQLRIREPPAIHGLLPSKKRRGKKKPSC